MDKRCNYLFLLMVLFLVSIFSISYSKAYANSTVDHSKLPALNKDFNTAEEVTKACLDCHNLAASQFKKTLHWTWEIGFDKRRLGKRHVINNY